MQLRRGCRGWQWMLLAVAADRITKVLAKRRALPRTLIPGVVGFRNARNSGMALSMLSGHFWRLTVFTALLIAGILFYLLSRPGEPPLLRAGLWLIAGGGLGNLYDRVTMGSVIDFIELDFVRFAIFNVADVCICVGAALVLLGAWRNERKKERTHGEV